jgi:hypothetical protein
MTNLAKRELDVYVEKRAVVPALCDQSGSRGGGENYLFGFAVTP